MAGPTEALSYFEREWQAISQAPFTFLIACVIVAGLVAAAFRWAYGARLANKDAIIQTKEAMIEWLSTQLSGQTGVDQAEILKQQRLLEKQRRPQEPFYGLWHAVHDFTLWQVAHLWVDQEPRPTVRPGDKAYPVFRRLKQDAESHKLMITSLGEGMGMDAWARTSRDALRAYATATGERPKFLFPEDYET